MNWKKILLGEILVLVLLKAGILLNNLAGNTWSFIIGIGFLLICITLFSYARFKKLEQPDLVTALLLTIIYIPMTLINSWRYIF
ncbi:MULTISPECIES: hypothetical protein [Sphingobacterium]|uniref:hypothetical protein n=1 Tax=Sphingobacterium TaxID=28453 RepID=UPI001628E267|nr:MULTISPECIES: hypothetical protein [Sphingobacterium]MBV2225602.1 hypothetical protein [Sphingobacterium mizutaii]